jgi:hypothetical protein
MEVKMVAAVNQSALILAYFLRTKILGNCLQPSWLDGSFQLEAQAAVLHDAPTSNLQFAHRFAKGVTFSIVVTLQTQQFLFRHADNVD